MVHESNPDATDGPNPYASSPISTQAISNPSSLNLPAWIAIPCCLASLGFWLFALIVSLPYGNPNAPPLIEILGFTGMFMVLPALGFVGAVSMLKRQRYGLCVAAACGMMIPLLGPCFGLTLPLGVWVFVLLRQRPIRDSFVTMDRTTEQHDNAEDAIAAASALERNEEWDAAIARYRVAADRWPEHATYIDNCIKDIAKRQTKTS